MRNKKWIEMRKGADYASICKQFNISLPFARLMRNRNICGQTAIEEYLYGSLSNLADPNLLPDVDVAVDLLTEVIEAQVPIRIVGDYDVDGVCATYCLYDALKGLGALVDVYLPDRKKDGYGINSRIVREAADEGIELIITCDNGITAKEALMEALNLGVSVIVTDHHEVADSLPPADAVVDPKREDSLYPHRDICGALVAWQLMRALYVSLGKNKESLRELLPFMALATICDVVPLTGDSRLIAREGISKMRTSAHVGLKALMEACTVDQECVRAYHLGFVLGPCINACGRLTNAREAFDLLIEEDPAEAKKRAEKICELNKRRRQLTEEGVAKIAELANDAARRDDKVYVLYSPECDETVAGIIAGRVRERTYRPAIILTKTEDGLVRGSGRSIPGYDLFAALNRHADLFEKYGGHEQAAGLTIKEENVSKLQEILNGEEAPSEEILTEKLYLDMVIPLSRCTMELAEELQMLEPTGAENRSPLFAARDVVPGQVRIMGREHNVLSFVGTDPFGGSLPFVSFRNVEAIIKEIDRKKGIHITDPGADLKDLKLTVAFTININEYRGKRSIQAVVQDVLI